MHRICAEWPEEGFMYTAPGEALPCEHDVRSEQAAGLRSVAALRISSQHCAATGAPVRAAAVALVHAALSCALASLRKLRVHCDDLQWCAFPRCRCKPADGSLMMMRRLRCFCAGTMCTAAVD